MTYDILARFYDLENATFTEDLDFWVSYARTSGGPVLELGCGTGRVTLQIARAGVAVVGLDNSEPMLAQARAKLARHPKVTALTTLVQGDMTHFEIPAPAFQAAGGRGGLFLFSLIIIPFNTFMHLQTADEQTAALASARRHLAPGKRLVLDLTNPAPAYADPPHETLTLERTFRDEAADLTIQQFSTARVDRTAQVAHIVYHYDCIARDGALTRALAPLRLRYTFPAEMKLLLERAGFRLAHLYGDYDESPLHDESERMIIVAEAV